MTNNVQQSPDLLAEIARLTAENARLKANKSGNHGLKVSEKGAVSVYGLGKWPVTLYRSQWESLFAKQEDIKAFLVANASLLKEKE